TASGISGVCFRTGQSQYCHDARRDERVDFESCQALGILSILISPVMVAERTVGLVEVFSPEEFFFDRTDISSLERIASLVAKAYERRLTAAVKPATKETPTAAVEPAAAPKAFAAAAATSVSSAANEVLAVAAQALSPLR